jgi:hypothetical protein
MIAHRKTAMTPIARPGIYWRRSMTYLVDEIVVGSSGRHWEIRQAGNGRAMSFIKTWTGSLVRLFGIAAHRLRMNCCTRMSILRFEQIAQINWVISTLVVRLKNYQRIYARLGRLYAV